MIGIFLGGEGGRGGERDKGKNKYLAEDGKFLARNTFLLRSSPDAIIAPLHQPPFQLDRVLNIFILPPNAAFHLKGQAFQHSVESGIIALRQK